MAHAELEAECDSGTCQQPALKIDVEAVNRRAAAAATAAASHADAGQTRPGALHTKANALRGGGPLNSMNSRGGGGGGGAPPTPGDAQTTEQTRADGMDTYGVVNRHPAGHAGPERTERGAGGEGQDHRADPADEGGPTEGGASEPGFTVGASVDRNKKCRRTMEDAHSFIYDFGGIRGQGYFAVFDGHAGKHAAEWCGHHFHTHLLDHLRKAPASTPVPDLLNATFLSVDAKLSELAVKGGTHSGCTAVTCFLRLEDDRGQPAGDASGVSKDVVPVQEVAAHELVADKDAALKVARRLEEQEEDARRNPGPGTGRRDKNPLDPFDGGRDTTAEELRYLREDEEEHASDVGTPSQVAEAESEPDMLACATAAAAAGPRPTAASAAAASEGASPAGSPGDSSSAGSGTQQAPGPHETVSDNPSRDLKQRIKNILGVSTSGGSSDLDMPSSAISATSEGPTPVDGRSPESRTTSEQVLPEAGTDTSAAAAAPSGHSPSLVPPTPAIPISAPAVSLPREKAPRRTLYTANVGDARAVLCRAGKAIRLTYDHKGTDTKEAKRISDAGGYVLNNRVNGVLAVTRSLGDSSMKEFVVGSPYTTETTLGPHDDFLIVACDGLWDVCTDQEAVDLIADCADDAQAASQKLLDHALNRFSTDNLSILVVSLHPPSKASQRRRQSTQQQGAGMIANP